MGRVDQWGEQGYLLFEKKVYAYDEDRKNQYGTTTSPMTIEAFLEYSKTLSIVIPEDFMRMLAEAQGE